MNKQRIEHELLLNLRIELRKEGVELVNHDKLGMVLRSAGEQKALAVVDSHTLAVHWLSHIGGEQNQESI